MTTRSSTRVIVAEDSPAFLASILGVLRLYPNVVVAGSVTHKSHLRHRVADERPDLLVLDFELADGDILDLLEHRDIPVESCVVLTAFPSSELEARLRTLGVAAFFDKAEIGPFISWLQARVA